MTFCLTTSYTQNYSAMADCCIASMYAYAARYNCDVYIEPDPVIDRPPAWYRVKLIPELFDRGYKYVLWLDADAMFVRFDQDILQQLEPDKDLYLAGLSVKWHPKPVPNTGVLLIRNTDWSRNLLSRIWDMTQYIHHGWWENGALIDLMGYHSMFLEKRGTDAPDEELLSKIKFLDERWNGAPPKWDTSSDLIIYHPSGQPLDRRISSMEQMAMTLGFFKNDRMIRYDLSDAEIHAGALRLYYPPEDRMLFVAPIQILTMRSLSHIFELTPSEARLVRDKARRLEQTLIELGR